MAEGSGNDEFALCYFNEDELPFIHPAARAYTLYDRFFCSLLTSTWPNRYYKWSGQSGGIITNYPEPPAGNSWDSIFDVALAEGRQRPLLPLDLPFSATFGARASARGRTRSRDYYATARRARSPTSPSSTRPSRGSSPTASRPTSIRSATSASARRSWPTSSNAFIRSPNYRKGALFITYDEWGGFFDHVRPPRVPDDRASRNLDEDFAQMGFRIPAVAVSPWTRRRSGGARFRVDHGVYGFESILKLISYRFGLGYLTKRHRYARNIGRSFDWESRPDFERRRAAGPARGRDRAVLGRRRWTSPTRRRGPRTPRT